MRKTGVVIIGQNEGALLGRALDSAAHFRADSIYVDAGSADGSPDVARKAGFETVELSGPKKTAGAARNAGIARLRGNRPGLAYVQLLDGDCVLADDWLDAARARLEERPDAGAVFGAVREAPGGFFPWLLGLERKLSPGEERSSGGNALVRLAAFDAAGGFDPDLIAAEDADLWRRLCDLGWRLERLERPMLTHESGISELAPWLRRLARQGYGLGQVMRRRGFSPADGLVRSGALLLLFGFILPLALVSGTAVFGRYTLLGAALFIPPYVNLFRTVRRRGCAPLGAAMYAAAEMFAKLPKAAGLVAGLRHGRD